MTMLTLRGMSKADIPAWNKLLAAVEAVDQTGEHYNEDDLVEEMENPDIDPGKDIVGGFLDGELVGYFAVYPRSGATGFHKVSTEGMVRPDLRGRGFGTQLAAAMKERALAAHAERHPDLPLKVMLSGLSSNDAQREVLAGIGMLPERYSFVMRAVLSEVPDPPVMPDGLEVVQYDASWDRAMHEAHNKAFLDHPNFTPWSESMWRQWVSESRNFRPELSYVVLDPAADRRVVAYVQTNEYDAHFEQTGRREAYVGKVGTLREYRGRGIAGALLGHCLAEYRRAGFHDSSLDVDSANPTGALGVYERAGFRVESRWTDYSLSVPVGLR